MAEISLRLEDGRTLDFDRTDVPLSRKQPKWASAPPIEHVRFGNLEASPAFGPGPDLVFWDPTNPQRVVAVEFKGAVSKNRQRPEFAENAVRTQLSRTQFPIPQNANVAVELWQLDPEAGVLARTSVGPAGELKGQTVYSVSNITSLTAVEPNTGAPTSPLSTAYVRRRVEDWQQRLSALYNDVRGWLVEIDQGFRVDDSRQMRMHEELMRKFAVPAVNIGIMEVFLDGAFVLALKPRGLWVIGANGRVDIISKSPYFLIDAAQPFQPPNWQLFGFGVTSGTRFDAMELRKIVR